MTWPNLYLVVLLLMCQQVVCTFNDNAKYWPDKVSSTQIQNRPSQWPRDSNEFENYFLTHFGSGKHWVTLGKELAEQPKLTRNQFVILFKHLIRRNAHLAEMAAKKIDAIPVDENDSRLALSDLYQLSLMGGSDAAK
jgi:hypothetical protein